MPLYGQIGKYAIPKGYVNATQMAKANRKLLSDYIRLKSTKDYLQALGNDMGIPISSLTIEIEGYGKEQGTWVNSAKEKASRKNILFFKHTNCCNTRRTSIKTFLIIVFVNSPKSKNFHLC
ncbi:MAG: KilA-N domain-containing protein [Nostoc sp.]|uniref:KilA-N domain-containing protein n=1 Tax=Nostoc sp. TaxID=1180 RepID=UPI002FF7FEED